MVEVAKVETIVETPPAAISPPSPPPPPAVVEAEQTVAQGASAVVEEALRLLREKQITPEMLRPVLEECLKTTLPDLIRACIREELGDLPDMLEECGTILEETIGGGVTSPSTTEGTPSITPIKSEPATPEGVPLASPPGQPPLAVEGNPKPVPQDAGKARTRNLHPVLKTLLRE